ncbi:MAG: HAD family hydrolase [Candidatus Aminicenantales bacterium]
MEKIIFWDWTGTLVDESLLDQAVCQTIEEELAAKKNITLSDAHSLFQEYLKSLENTWQWHDYILHGRNLGIDWKIPQEKNLEKLILLPHAEDILQHARDKGYKNVLATNAVRKVIELRVNHAGLLPLIDAIVASDDVYALKSEGKHFTSGLKILNGNPRLSFSIGNNPVQDILPAQRLHLKTILCDFGKELTHYHSEHISDNHKVAVSSDYRIHQLLEVMDII